VSDQPYGVNRGRQQNDQIPDPFPANFVAETSGTQMAVVSQGLDQPNANRAFYRVVAVDANGKRSWSSAFAVSPRPFIHTDPVTAARVGEAYGYQVKAIRSLGDARNRGRDGMGYWDVEQPAYTIEQGPAWLTIDPATGLLSGMPDVVGPVQVVVQAVIEREVPVMDEAALAWGNYKTTGTTKVHVGSTTQEFTIEVAP
jgi:hypothetical protein